MISGVMSADCDPSTIPTSSPAPSRSAGCVGGLHEACVGVTDLEEAITDFRAWGCRPGLRGHLDAAAWNPCNSCTATPTTVSSAS